MVNGQDDALPNLHANVQDWRDRDVASVAVFGAGRFQIGSVTLPQPVGIHRHYCADRQSAVGNGHSVRDSLPVATVYLQPACRLRARLARLCATK